MIGDDDLEGPKRPTLERIADSLESIAGEVYRIRVALEVVAGDALDRAALEAIEAAADLNDLVTGAGAARGAHPAGGELRYLGRLGPDGVVGSIPDDLDLDDLEGES